MPDHLNSPSAFRINNIYRKICINLMKFSMYKEKFITKMLSKIQTVAVDVSQLVMSKVIANKVKVIVM